MKCETYAERSEARNFLKKYKKKGPKIHCLALKLYTGPPNCITGASKSGGQGGPPLDPLVVQIFSLMKEVQDQTKSQSTHNYPHDLSDKFFNAT